MDMLESILQLNYETDRETGRQGRREREGEGEGGGRERGRGRKTLRDLTMLKSILQLNSVPSLKISVKRLVSE